MFTSLNFSFRYNILLLLTDFDWAKVVRMSLKVKFLDLDTTGVSFRLKSSAPWRLSNRFFHYLGMALISLENSKYRFDTFLNVFFFILSKLIWPLLQMSLILKRADVDQCRTVTRSFDVFFDLHLNKRLSKQPWGWWFETPSWSFWRQCNEKSCDENSYCILRGPRRSSIYDRKISYTIHFLDSKSNAYCKSNIPMLKNILAT